uniref:Zn(2)-C6 fungal-type domain-containing protein n=1 Tax=Mycena chlorophos TaxID=658473 RepID=A0ABQ0LQW8_MYCCL|nr:predicted protein [Mycena chlorophos]
MSEPSSPASPTDPFAVPKRVQVACVQCRKRKVKCLSTSEEDPCLNCQLRGMQCEYRRLTDGSSSSARRRRQRPTRTSDFNATLTTIADPSGGGSEEHSLPQAELSPTAGSGSGPLLYAPYPSRQSAPRTHRTRHHHQAGTADRHRHHDSSSSFPREASGLVAGSNWETGSVPGIHDQWEQSQFLDTMISLDPNFSPGAGRTEFELPAGTSSSVFGIGWGEGSGEQGWDDVDLSIVAGFVDVRRTNRAFVG